MGKAFGLFPLFLHHNYYYVIYEKECLFFWTINSVGV